MQLSIITINYNNAEGLRKTLASVASQTYPHIEHIIVDGGSTDNSVEILEAYPQPLPKRRGEITEDKFPTQNPAHKVIWVSEKDTGIYNAMNKGIEIALGRRVVTDDHTSLSIANQPILNPSLKGRTSYTAELSPFPLGRAGVGSDYIQILNSGDMLAAPDVTERMMAALEAQQAKGERLEAKGTMDEVKGEENGKSDTPASTPYTLHPTPTDTSRLENPLMIFYGNMIKEYPNGKRITDKCKGDRNSSTASIREIEWTMYDFIGGTINHNPTYIHRSLYEKYGLYDDNLKIVSDWKWFVNVVVFGEEKVFYAPIDVTIFDMTGISETNLIERENERIDQLKKMLPATILKDYNEYLFPIFQYNHLQRYHLWSIVYFVERVLFKLEKWKIIKI